MKPSINIRHGKLIEPFFNGYVSLNYPDFKFPSDEEVRDKVDLFKKSWDENEIKFFDFLYSTTGLEFKRNVIDCFIVSATPRDMSAPLIIRSRYTEKEFLDVMYHELIHILFSDNKVKEISGYENESKKTRNHIQLFCLLKEFYLDILDSREELNRIISKSDDSKNTDYKKAWKIVDSLDYKKVNRDF